LASYHLPFEYIEAHWRRPDYTYKWFALIGDGHQTHLQGLKLVERSFGTVKGVWNKETQDYSAATWKECVQETLHSVPYYALPANDDFIGQFNIIRGRMMEEWYDQKPKEKETWTYDWSYNQGYPNWTWYDLYPDMLPKTDFIDETTRKLIELATNNTNIHEASNAAMKACKRLRKKLKD
jgi:hypothetical protein